MFGINRTWYINDIRLFIAWKNHDIGTLNPGHNSSINATFFRFFRGNPGFVGTLLVGSAYPDAAALDACMSL